MLLRSACQLLPGRMHVGHQHPWSVDESQSDCAPQELMCMCILNLVVVLLFWVAPMYKEVP